MSLFRRNYDTGPKGEQVVRVLAFVMAAFAIFGGIRGHGGGAYLCWLTAGLFLVTAALPRSLGRIAGTLIVILSALALFMGLHGEPDIAARNVLLAIPSLIIGGLMVHPAIVDAVLAMTRSSD